jgi:probable rRNA maturation factor
LKRPSRPAPRARSQPATRARSALELAVQYAAPRAGLPHRRSLERWALAALQRPAVISVRFVTRTEGRALNRAYRRKDYATNVLTFVYAPETDRGRNGLAGDIVLCAPVVASEARAQGKTLGAHYAHLVVHGVLHLQGFDHARARDARHMEAREKQILARLGYADPYD